MSVLNSISARQITIINFLLIILFVATYLGVSMGGVKISFIDFISGQTDNLQTTIMEKIRIPRVALSGVVGASLAISGASLQGLFRNPLADPGLIGVSAGAALGATLSIVLGKDLLPSHLYGAYLLPLSAIIGSTLVSP